MSFWLDTPREGFAARCCEYFDTHFNDSDTFVQRSDYIKVPNRPHKIAHGFATGDDAIARSTGRRSNTRQANAGLKRRASLLS